MQNNAAMVWDQHPIGLSGLQSNKQQILGAVVWLLGLWLWGSVLNRTPPAVDLAIITISFIPAIVVFWNQPEFGIIAVMFFASGFLPPEFVDVRFLGGGFEMPDIMLILVAGVMVFKQLANKTLSLPLFPVGALLALFFVFVALSLFNALFLENVAMHWALSDARILSFYLTFFLVAWGITDKRGLFVILASSFVLNDITAIIIPLQQYLGTNHFLIVSMTSGGWSVWDDNGIVRVVPPGIAYLYFMNLIAIALMSLPKIPLRLRLFLLAQSIIFSSALLLTYTRSAWVASAFALGIMLTIGVIIYRRYLLHIVGLLSVVISLFTLGIIALNYVKPVSENTTVISVTERINSMFEVESAAESYSMRWRLFEYQEARKAIAEHPFTGLGLGNSYRPLTVLQGEAQGSLLDNDISYLRVDRFTRYTHSSYLAIPLKMGIPALIVLLGFCATAIITSFVLFIQIPNALARAITLGIGAGLIGLLEWSIMHAQLMLASSTPVIGLMVGLLACMYTIYLAESHKMEANE